MINGSFNIIQIQNDFLFLKREDSGLWDAIGGGFDTNEIDYKEVNIRETQEETGIILNKKELQLCAILGQKLKKTTAEKHGVEKGLVFLHTSIFYEEKKIVLSDEHTDWNIFSYKEILNNWKDFTSGSLWMFFTILAFHQNKKIQEGSLYARRFWQGKEYVT